MKEKLKKFDDNVKIEGDDIEEEFKSYAASTLTKEGMQEKNMTALWSDPHELINKAAIQEDMKPVNLKVLEYGWLLKGKAGEQFIQYLSSKKSDSSIFKIQGV